MEAQTRRWRMQSAIGCGVAGILFVFAVSLSRATSPAPEVVERGPRLVPSSTTHCRPAVPSRRLSLEGLRPCPARLFAAWYDRRNDPNNSLIDLDGRWGTIESDGSVTLGSTDFRITTESFPPVFAGTLTQNTQEGYYDPVCPPGGVNLHWWYQEWPPKQEPPFDHLDDTFPDYNGHVGEYNHAWSDETRIYLSWSDNRTLFHSAFSQRTRHQPDIHFIALDWPE